MRSTPCQSHDRLNFSDVDKEWDRMTIQSHLQELKRRHAAIEQELGQELSRPASDQARIVELKRKKLALKEQITKLGQTATVH